MKHQRIRIGNQTSPYVPADKPYRFALEHRFDAFEWFSDKGTGGWDEDNVTRRERLNLRQAAQSNDLLFSVHAPCWADPVSPRGALAIQKSIRFAEDVGGRIVNFHLPAAHDAKPVTDALITMADIANNAGVRLSIENTPQTSPEQFNLLFEYLAGMANLRKTIGMCFDMGHANLYPDTRNDYLGFLSRLRENVRIIHCHVHENWGDIDSHLTLFTGPSGRDDTGVRFLVQALLVRGYSGVFILEQWPNPPELLIEARIGLRSILGSIE